MGSPSLSRLQTVDPRLIWPHEALNFTPWLLSNVDVVSDLLGMDLVLEEAEHPVGGFSLDLRGYDESTGEVVIVQASAPYSEAKASVAQSWSYVALERALESPQGHAETALYGLLSLRLSRGT